METKCTGVPLIKGKTMDKDSSDIWEIPYSYGVRKFTTVFTYTAIRLIVSQ
jgi:hypothetical protein